MRPLARKIFLTQGLVILMVFGVSGFAYLSLGSARDRAAALAADYAIGKAHESLGAELRDIERSRSIYFIERRTDGEMMPQLRNSFYESLERVALGVEELAQRAGERDDLGSLIQSLRSQLLGYRRAVAEQELARGLGDDAAFQEARTRSEVTRERMQDLNRKASRERTRTVSAGIGALEEDADEAALLALVFSGMAVLVGGAATLWLTNSIHRPVRDLRAATVALSHGEFDRRIDVRHGDELGDLARAFNEMAARLQELDEMKNDFVSMVSHDLKTPLTSMKEAVDLLAEGIGGELTERQKRLLSITREGTDRLANYVQGILDLFRFEAGHIHLVRDPLAISDLVAEQAALVEVRCRDAGIEVICQQEDDLPLVEGDRFRLGQVLANLLDNAIKFTPRAGRIVVRTSVEPWEDGMAVILEVTDTGVGIAARDLRHVFDKFFQATRTQGRNLSGAGLGLAIVKNLVQAHDGRVTATSTVAKGTSFRVVLPAAPRAVEDVQVLAG